MITGTRTCARGIRVEMTSRPRPISYLGDIGLAHTPGYGVGGYTPLPRPVPTRLLPPTSWSYRTRALAVPRSPWSDPQGLPTTLLARLVRHPSAALPLHLGLSSQAAFVGSRCRTVANLCYHLSVFDVYGGSSGCLGFPETSPPAGQPGPAREPV